MEKISLVLEPDTARRRMIKVLNGGGVVIYPTDTVYGVGGCADIVGMGERIAALKNRELDKPFPYLVSDCTMAENYGIFSEPVRVLAKTSWPGATTLIVHSRDGVGTIGLRVPGDAWLREVIVELKGAIIGTSANKSGYAPATNVERAMDMLDADLAVDGGERSGAPSEVIDCTVNSPKTLRIRE